MLSRLYETRKTYKQKSKEAMMKKMAKKQYIPQFFKRDKDGMTALSRTGICRTETLKEQCNLSDGRINNWVRDGYAEKIHYKDTDKETKVVTMKEAVVLTKGGKRLIEKQWNVHNHYKAQTQSPYHDLELSDKYFSLTEEERNSWQTETEIRHQFLEKIESLRDQGEDEKARLYEKMMSEGRISMPDGVYTNTNGIEMAFEVITGSYGPTEMLAKECTVEIMGFGYETSRI